eukprot:1316772-Rhodomonas_salina.2
MPACAKHQRQAVWEWRRPAEPGGAGTSAEGRVRDDAPRRPQAPSGHYGVQGRHKNGSEAGGVCDCDGGALFAELQPLLRVRRGAGDADSSGVEA